MPFTLKTLHRISFLALLSTVITGCGFHLQGNYQLPAALQTLKLESSDEYSEISRLLKARLMQRDVIISDKKGLSILRLGKERFERGTMSLFSTGQVAEYELIYSLKYQVIKYQQEPMPFEVTIRRDYLDDTQSAQAKSREREQLLREIRQQATKEIVQQISQLN